MSARKESVLLTRMAAPSARSFALIFFCVGVFLLGGGSRGDVASLILLRPLAFLLLAYALAVGVVNDIRRHSAIALLLAAMVVIAVVHLVPLSPRLWQALPGREIVRQTDTLAGLGAIARPLTLNITDGTNALFSLAVPVAALALLSVQRSDWRRATLITLLGLGIISLLFALLQLLGPANGPFYLYRITSGSSPVGLFANRNHQAVFLACLVPSLGVFAADGKNPHRGQADRRPFRRAVAWLGLILILIFVLASGSRAGLIVSILAILSVPFVLGLGTRTLFMPGRSAAGKALVKPATIGSLFMSYWRLIAVVALAMGLSLLAAFGRFGSPLDRVGSEGDNRSVIWNATLPLVREYFPWGSGVGSFVDVFAKGEPYANLGPKYVNHAHNDLLEVALTAGLPGIIVAGSLLLYILRRGVALWRHRKETRFPQQLARAGLVVAMLLLLASLVDYPLRTPALMVMFVIAMSWLTPGNHEDNSEGSGA